MQTQRNTTEEKQQWWRDPAVREPAPMAVTQEMEAVPTVVDLWEELEAEAVRRATDAQNAVVVQGSNAVYRRKRMRLAYTVIIPLGIIYGIFGLLGHNATFLAMALGYALTAFYTHLVTKKSLRESAPFVSVSPLGITADTPEYRLGPLFWDEIESVRASSLLGTHSVQITLKDPKKTLERALKIKEGPLHKLQRWAYTLAPFSIATNFHAFTNTDIADAVARFRPDLIKR